MGEARCGTSLTMEMLRRAGLKMPGNFPLWEAKQNEKKADGTYHRPYDVVKMLMPCTKPLLEPGDYLILRLSREDQNEQIKSMIKYVKKGLGIERRKSENLIRLDAKKIVARRRANLNKRMHELTTRPIRFYTFEKIIEDPRAYAEFLCDNFGLDKVNLDNMVSAYVPRSAKCQPEMVELKLMEVYQKAGYGDLKLPGICADFSKVDVDVLQGIKKKDE